MRQGRKIVPLNLSNDLVGHPTFTFSLSNEAQVFVSEILDDTFSLRLSIDLGPDGSHIASLHGPPDLVELFASLKLQVRCEIVADGYNVLTQDAIDAFVVSPESKAKLLEALDLREGDKVLDLMSGNGAVSQLLLEYADEKAMEIALSLCDTHYSQLKRIDPNVRERVVDVTVGDARALPYERESFDTVVLKMGLHEVPQLDQPLVMREVFRVLRKGGRFIIWQLLPASGVMQDVFTDIVRKSSMLARCESQAFNRYFPRQDQLAWLFKGAGFNECEEIFRAEFAYSTQARLSAELGGDSSKLEILNRFARDRAPQEVRDSMFWRDTGEDISLKVPACIYRTYKPS
ncbi:class I SAM-dependent methyltransferase [Microbulbifer variabilis]|uniref:class I SAM-dependent methyltransferase n=1 Tax=Microbulbifer variabilis TaxID=266805 RepID=UPI001CFD2FEC|nr:class I SAM-dependent methyltransferase [Microbulbifer variabilis]